MINDDNGIYYNTDEDTQYNDSHTEEAQTEEIDYKAELEAERARRIKAEAILERNKKQKNTDETISTPQSGEFDLATKSYLKASGIKSNEFEFVRNELKAAGGDIDSLLENEYFQAKLEKQRAIQATSDATPKGRGGNGVPTDSVEYWLNKPFEEVPQDMRRSVLNARVQRENKQGVFYNS